MIVTYRLHAKRNFVASGMSQDEEADIRNRDAELFSHWDEDHSGTLTIDEIKTALHVLK
jgi:hypothetical protein